MIPSVWPMSTPDGLLDDPSDRRSLSTPWLAEIAAIKSVVPDFQECIIGGADEDISRASICPTAAIDIVVVSGDFDCPPISQKVVN